MVDFKKYIEKGGVFKKLEDLEYFRKFAVNHELRRNNLGIMKIDLAPETIYSEATKRAFATLGRKSLGIKKERLRYFKF